jgi:arginine deiminase
MTSLIWLFCSPEVLFALTPKVHKQKASELSSGDFCVTDAQFLFLGIGALISRQESGWTPLFHSSISAGEVMDTAIFFESSIALGK